MWSKLVLFFCISAVSATIIRHNNYCQDTLLITETDDDGTTSLVCKPIYGTSCSKNYPSTNGWAWFQHGWFDNATVVDLLINSGSYDYYHIHLIHGFDIPVMISSKGGQKLLCLDKDCDDNFIKSSKQGSTSTGAVITVSWCPENIGAFENEFGQKELPLIKSIKNAPKIKSSLSRRLLNKRSETGKPHF